MNNTLSNRLIIFSFSFLLLFCGITQAKPVIFIEPNKIIWRDGPKSLPTGVKYAILVGNPSKPGLFTMRLKFPANYELPAHYHLLTENVTVISGKVYFGHGDKLDKKKGKLFSVGGFVSIPKRVNHYAWTTDEGTILQLNNNGPWEIIYVDPSKDPRKQ